jgi:hypothetical protein
MRGFCLAPTPGSRKPCHVGASSPLELVWEPPAGRGLAFASWTVCGLTAPQRQLLADVVSNPP